MQTIIIKPEIVNNQYLFTLPEDLEEQELEFVLKIHYSPKKQDPPKELWFMDLKRIDLSNETFSRDEMYDDWGR